MKTQSTLIERTPWRQTNPHRLDATWNGIPVVISRVFYCGDRPSQRWNAIVNGELVGRWGGTIKQCVQSIAKHIRNIRTLTVYQWDESCIYCGKDAETCEHFEQEKTGEDWEIYWDERRPR